MISIDEILKQKGISKADFARKLNIIPQNANRTIKRLDENQSEIDCVLKLLNAEPASIDCSTNSINESQQRTIETQAETINRQSKIIETLTNK